MGNDIFADHVSKGISLMSEDKYREFNRLAFELDYDMEVMY